ncbi:FAD-dependent oxidoreductase [Campylobacter sp. RM16190]|uniref:NAD(P)/FAD-dependent oxidoreductase n=1 Tax=Campylobacter sp. RM16190 TaxID=1705727 RepID=UPI001474FDDE|nr:FAD-dependent oxidoreductase [Campylobacter sp. RM16190]
MKDVVVVGSGISGLFSAYWCVKNSLSVAVVSKTQKPETNGLNTLNLFLGAHRSLFDEVLKFARGDGFVGFKNLADKAFLNWLLKFSVNQTRPSKKLEILTRRYGLKSYEIYQNLASEIGGFEFESRGEALVFFDDKKYKFMLENIKFNDENFEILDIRDENTLGLVKNGVKGALNLKKNARLDAQKLYENLKAFLERSGVAFITDEIVDYEVGADGVRSVIGRLDRYEASSFIQASGDDKNLVKKLGVNFDLISAKIYEVSFEANEDISPKMPLMIDDFGLNIDAKNGLVNIVTKPQINAKDALVDIKEINENLAKLKPYTSFFELKNPTFKAKNLAFTPNSLPIFGRDESYKNLLYISGFGLNESLFAPCISKILTDMIVRDISNENSDDVLLFSGIYA